MIQKISWVAKLLLLVLAVLPEAGVSGNHLFPNIYGNVPQIDGLHGYNTKVYVTKDNITFSTLDFSVTYNHPKIRLYKKAFSRGFYFRCFHQDKVPEANRTIKLVFRDYSEQEVSHWDRDWSDDPTNATYHQSNYIRGVNYVEISLAPEGKQTGVIEIFEQNWYMSERMLFFFWVLVGLLIGFQLFKMCDAKWFCFYDGDQGQEKSENKWVLLGLEAKNIALHNLDVFSDFTYILTVPCYSVWIQILIFAFMIPPILVCFYQGAVTFINGEGLFKSLFICIQEFTGSTNFFEILLGTESSEVKKSQAVQERFLAELDDYKKNPENMPSFEHDIQVDKKEKEYIEKFNDFQKKLKARRMRKRMIQGTIFILEDGPQFILQTLNSLLVGKSWTWIQVTSPITSIMALTGRFYIRRTSENIEEVNQGIILTLLVNLVIIAPVTVLALANFEYIDRRPSWSSSLSSIRWGSIADQNATYPLVRDRYY